MSENPVDLSILALFDDLTRCTSVLTDGASDEVFLAFVQSYQDIKRAYCHGNEEIRRLQQELDEALTTISNLETKLNNARRLHDLENRMRKRAENERDDLERKMRICRDLLWKDGEARDDETRSKLAFLNSPRRRRSFFGEHTIDEEEPGPLGFGNTTGSLLSDMSVTVSEEDFLDNHREKGQKRTKSVRSDASTSLGKRFRPSSDARRRSSHRTMEVDATDKIVASTKVTVPQGDGPIVAESVIEARPQDEEHEEEQQQRFFTPKKGKSPSRRVKPMAPSAPPMEDLTSLEEPELAKGSARKDHEEVVYATVHKQATPTSVHRQHHFTPRTHFGGDVCAGCGKKIRFGTSASKCRDCRIVIHTGCTSTFSMCCVPPVAGGRDGKATIQHRTPAQGPMVPPLIVYCVSEIEARGLTEVGIYRVSGSEKEVKALKEKFLRGKGVPQINNVDVHVLCGTVKDFLRSLPEPLMPRAQWNDFCNAIQNPSPERAQRELFDAIENMPQANRDTLAFLIQHFQRIAQVPQVKMPIGNIAKIFAPTIVGTSHSDVSNHHAVLAQINIQVEILEALLGIPTDYWMRFVMYDSGSTDETPKQTPSKYAVTPIRKPREKKYYDTPPFYPKKK
ncbi:rac GTPase-activating protein 1 [Lutzomyia longipalpis]|uniref:rac GTPase-activating protein 1 n=1 Tax=Lutzomyia longipalpis TaxID=7200 RepID=UPI002483E3D1|nr:rac GTPase-activating protein 1 [Lutzomyia longipalpis]